MSTLAVAVVQHDIVWEDGAATRAGLTPLVAQATEGGARLVVLTEMFATGFSPRTEVIAEAPDGPTVSWMHERAAATGVWVLGSVCLRPGSDAGALPSNVAVLVGPGGEDVRYAKRHLFSYAGEHERLAAGTEAVVAEVDGVRLGLSVCYDLRFADDYWAIAPQVDGYVVVANWPEERIAHWRALLVARAVENQAWVIGANRVGRGGRLSYSGDSLVLDPMGEVVADGAGGAPLVLEATVSAARVAEVRDRYPFLADR